MFKNYFKIAWRNLFRNKGFSITNILGLTIGMTCTMLILLWVKDELSYNKFHKNYDNIYEIIANRDFKNQVFTDYNMVLPLNQEIQKNIPQVKNAIVSTWSQSNVLSYGENKLTKNGYTVGGNYFDMFSWRFIKGNASTAIKDPSSIVLTESAATALFGKADPIDKILKIDNSDNAKVTAIVADPPDNSSFKFDYIRPFNYSSPDIQRQMNEWTNSSWNILLEVAPGTDTALLNKNINTIKKQHDTHDQISTYFVFPMSRWRLFSDFKDGKNTGGMISYVKLFTIIAIIVLLIACVNFMNLSTARSEKRAKEVGIRKTLGSYKRQLVLQFFFESMILASIALVFSLIAVYLLLPSFNLLVEKKMVLDLSSPAFWAGALAIVAITGVIAGSYPALYLSSFNPVNVLKGTFLPGKKAILPRRILVVGQFVISILLISATIIVYKQIQFVKNRDMGYNPNNLIMISSTPETDKNFAVIKQELLRSGLISGVTRTGTDITQVQWRTDAPDWDGKPAGVQIIMGGSTADVDFAKTMGIKMIAGNDFSGTASDSSAMLLNKSAVEVMGLKNPVGMQIRQQRRSGVKKFTVIGVTDNVVAESPYEPVNPMMIFYNPNWSGTINIRLSNGVQPQKALQSMAAVFKTYNPAYPFEYKFVDQEFGKKFFTEELINKITNIFAGLAIFICCIGLAGLASFTIEKRIREIGIRKVLGATVQQLLMLISKEFLKLVLLAFVIATPLTWWLMHNWLQNYEYRTTIDAWIFGAVGALILLLTLVVVSLNTARAAMRNPTKSLRSE
ncbi:MAG: ABC transporter permease [Bacteroidetes bacterium]|nr:ABC transporter permease [Bacteroidota bacterium]